MRWLYLGGFLSIVGTFVADIWFDINYQTDANISLTYLAILVSTFTIIYGVRSKWRSSNVGISFFIKSVFLSLVLIQIVVSAWWSADYPYRHEIRFVMHTAGAWTYAAMVLQLLRSQRIDREQRRAAEYWQDIEIGVEIRMTEDDSPPSL